MIRHSTSFYCRRCGQVRRFAKRGFNSRLHLLTTLLTFGLWAPVWWFLQYRDQRRSWRCAVCRGRQRPGEEPAGASEPRTPTVPLIPLVPRR